MKKTISIIGVGLIGGSLGMALKNHKIIGIGRHIEKLKLAKKLGAIDEYTTDFINGTKLADIVVICTPVETIVPIYKKIAPYLKKNTIVTDVGSIKSQIVSQIQKYRLSLTADHLPIFIGGHPLAGAEKTSVKYSSSDLFKKATVVLTLQKKYSKIQKSDYIKSVNVLKQIWVQTGANVMIMTPEEHDKLVAVISHLPHLLSAALVKIVYKQNKSDNRLNKLIAGSFRDVTRISDSDPINWANICYLNKKNLSEFINSYCAYLKNIDLNSLTKLKQIFSTTKTNRTKLLT